MYLSNEDPVPLAGDVRLACMSTNIYHPSLSRWRKRRVKGEEMHEEAWVIE